MKGAPQRGRGFTLIELLIVVAIIAVLISILLPSLGKAREQARMVHCASGLRQWGMAIGYYLNDYNTYIPAEGASGSVAGVTDEGAWYNALPPYAHAPKYSYIYAGVTARVGTTVTDPDTGHVYPIKLQADAGGYQNSYIWYCQTQLASKKNSGSGATQGLNSFHYSMNAVLNGSTSFGGEGITKFIKLALISEPAATPFLFDSSTNSPNDSNSGISNRHSAKANMLFIDQHLETIYAANATTPTRPNTNLPFISTTGGQRLVWGPFVK